MQRDPYNNPTQMPPNVNPNSYFHYRYNPYMCDNNQYFNNKMYNILDKQIETVRLSQDITNRELNSAILKLDNILNYNRILMSKLEKIELENKELKTELNNKNKNKNYKKFNNKKNNRYGQNKFKKINRPTVNKLEILGKKADKPEINGMIIQMDTVTDTSANLNKDNPLSSFFGSLVSSMQKKRIADEKKKTVKNEVDDVISEYDSDDEFEELPVDMEKGKLQDLIKLGGLYEEEKKANKPVDKNKSPFTDLIKSKTKTNECVDSDTSENNSFDNVKPMVITVDEDNDEEHEDKEKEEEEYEEEEDKKSEEDTKGEEKYQDKVSRIVKNARNTLNKYKNIKPDDHKIMKIGDIRKKKSSAFVMNGKKYGINLKTLNKLIKPLEKLNSLVGLETTKNSIIDMILYFLQNFEKGNDNMLHTIIEGPPGVGKTELGKILAEIYCCLGIIKSNKFKVVKRSDLIGEYLGQTSIKTQRVIDSADGGVLFIDEAYALGHSEKRDSYSKECLDTINQNLSENKNRFICIIAGYADELEECFFGANPGLKRRFPFRFRIDGYSPNELKQIFEKKVVDNKWKLQCNNDKLLKFFESNKESFPHFGGDMETLLVECKFCHSRRVAGKHPKKRRKLTDDDIEKGFKRFTSNKKKKKDETPLHLYT